MCPKFNWVLQFVGSVFQRRSLYKELKETLTGQGVNHSDERLRGLCEDLKRNREIRVLLSYQRFTRTEVRRLSPQEVVQLAEEWAVRKSMEGLNQKLREMFPGDTQWVESEYIQRRVHLAASDGIKRGKWTFYRLLETDKQVVDLIRLLGRVSGKVPGVLDDEALECLVSLGNESPYFLPLEEGELNEDVNADMLEAIEAGDSHRVYQLSILNRLDQISGELLASVTSTHTPAERIGKEVR